MAVIYMDAADVNKDELAQLLRLLESEQEAESPEAKTERLLALAERVGVKNAAEEAREARGVLKCR